MLAELTPAVGRRRGARSRAIAAAGLSFGTIPSGTPFSPHAQTAPAAFYGRLHFQRGSRRRSLGIRWRVRSCRCGRISRSRRANIFAIGSTEDVPCATRRATSPSNGQSPRRDALRCGGPQYHRSSREFEKRTPCPPRLHHLAGGQREASKLRDRFYRCRVGPLPPWRHPKALRCPEAPSAYLPAATAPDSRGATAGGNYLIDRGARPDDQARRWDLSRFRDAPLP